MGPDFDAVVSRRLAGINNLVLAMYLPGGVWAVGTIDVCTSVVDATKKAV
jgi:hypothetical protein